MFESIVSEKLKVAGIQPDQIVLLAFSSGPDSVFLARQLLKIKQPFALAHVNYHLRDAESDADEAFAVQYAEEAGIQIHLHHANPAEREEGVQEWARKVRYTFFEETMEAHSFKALLTAHHADDQHETLLLNLFRGKPLQGLLMPELRANPFKTIRPLLTISKSEILAELQNLHIPFRTDSSNSSIDYNRNWIRNSVLTEASGRFPSVENALRWVEQDIRAHSILVEFIASSVIVGNRIQKNVFFSLPDAIRIVVLRFWLSENGVKKGLPEVLRESTAVLEKLEKGKKISLGTGQFLCIDRDFLRFESSN